MERKITVLKVQKRNRERVNVYLDGMFAFGLSRIVAAYLQVGQVLSEKKIESLLADDTREKAYQQALKFLTYRERSEAEIRQNLKKRDIYDEVTNEILERLRSNGLVDDERFAQTWVENRIEFRPRSRRLLALELRKKGIEEETIQQAIEQADDDKSAYQAALKRSHRLKNLEWPVFRQKMYGFLARRGFNYETTAPIITRIWAELHSDKKITDNLSYEEVNL